MTIRIINADVMDGQLSAEYAALAERRIKGDCPMFASVEVSA